MTKLSEWHIQFEASGGLNANQERVMAKLPEWYPEGSEPIQSEWTKTFMDEKSEYLGFNARVDRAFIECPSWAEVQCLTDEFGYPAGLFIDTTYLWTIPDDELIRVIRAAHESLISKVAYNRIAMFLLTPRSDTGPDWTREDFRREFQTTYEIAKKYSDKDIPEWRLAFESLTAYWNRDNAEGGFIYCLHDQLGHYKLGLTKHLNNRIKQLSTQPPFELSLEFSFKVLFARDYEASLHRRYAEKRLHGEWFDLTPDDLRDIKLRAGLDTDNLTTPHRL